MKIKYKHILPYIQHGVKCIDKNGRIKLVVLDHFSCTTTEIGYNYILERKNNAHTHKMILNPISCLCEKTKIKGGVIVPILELMKIKYNSWIKYYSSIGVDTKVLYEDNCAWFILNPQLNINLNFFEDDIFSYPPYWIIEKFNEWHIDYMGLIKNNLAIDATSLKK